MANESQSITDKAAQDMLGRTLRFLRESKPDDRSLRARQYAVTITLLEQVYAYFYTYVIMGHD